MTELRCSLGREWCPYNCPPDACKSPITHMGGKKGIIIPSAPGIDPADDSDRATWAAMRHYGQVKADIRKRQFEQEGLNKLQETVGDKITRHTEYHYSFQLNKKRVDFWPSRGHWRYENKKYHGTISNLCSFVANRKGI